MLFLYVSKLEGCGYHKGIMSNVSAERVIGIVSKIVVVELIEIVQQAHD